MRLLTAAASPFVRKCRVVLIETGQDDVSLHDVAASPMAENPEINAANPVGKIPALVRDDGPALFDSRVICRFLDDRAGGGAGAGLYPQDRLWDVLTLEALGDAVAEAAVGMTYEARFREAPGLVWPDWLEGQWRKVERALDAAEGRMMPLLEGPVNMGQVALGCALGYLDLRHDARGWRDERAALAAWEARFAARPSMQATRPA